MNETKKIYAIFGATDNDAVDQRIIKKYPDADRRQLLTGQWLISSTETTLSSIYEHLTKEDDPIICIIVPVSNYYGWQDAAVWEWIAANGK
ncbi:MAG: hypothetical protein GQ582_03230 [Methyloprofundus sp.]|nr:hypothetical protein [Methyloprofundus sp.]